MQKNETLRGGLDPVSIRLRRRTAAARARERTRLAVTDVKVVFIQHYVTEYSQIHQECSIKGHTKATRRMICTISPKTITSRRSVRLLVAAAAAGTVTKYCHEHKRHGIRRQQGRQSARRLLEVSVRANAPFGVLRTSIDTPSHASTAHARSCAVFACRDAAEMCA